MPHHDNYVIRPAKEEEVSFIFEQADLQGWNPCPVDQQLFYGLDPGGFLVGEFQGKVVACITGIKYDDRFAAISYFIVVPECRGHGFGVKIFEAIQKRLEVCGVVSLNAVPSKVPMYNKFGFQELYRDTEYTGRGRKGHILPPPAAAAAQSRWHMEAVPNFKRKADIVRYDAASKAHCVDRESLLNRLVANLDGYVVTSEDPDINGTVIGYGLIRKAKDGWKCGPLVGDSYEVAFALFQALCSVAEPEEKVSILVPSVSSQSVEMVLSQGFAVRSMYTRMCTGSPKPIDPSKVYAQFSTFVG